jgi:hypothetical protein
MRITTGDEIEGVNKVEEVRAIRGGKHYSCSSPSANTPSSFLLA